MPANPTMKARAAAPPAPSPAAKNEAAADEEEHHDQSHEPEGHPHDVTLVVRAAGDVAREIGHGRPRSRRRRGEVVVGI